jgi:gluconate 2-dehydrogenase gamma chain
VRQTNKLGFPSQRGLAAANAEAPNPSRRSFIKIGAGVVAGAAAASAVAIPFYSSQTSDLQNQLNAANAKVAQSNQQATTLQSQVSTLQTEANAPLVYLALSTSEAALMDAVAETIIPTDSNGPGGKEANVTYFIDKQLMSDYGNCGTMYMQGPFVLPGQKGPITVQGITYPNGTPPQRINTGTRYQYPMDLRSFIKTGLNALQKYANSAFGGNFQSLSSDNQLQVLKDLWSNKPTSFNNLQPIDFAYELFFLVWSGFLMDPMYGGNKDMVGWQLLGYNGLNFGNFYGEGLTSKQLMVDNKPTRLKPASLSQYQQGTK